ncbi:MAG TPA: AIR synthase-related protein [Pirellulales bacterium]|jgi:phosphoribosylformylglycinamidine synthase|nr:AIR synthase-related protein [Pirellulales bacterium]
MLWEVDIYPRPGQPDRAALGVLQQAADLGWQSGLQVRSGYGYLLQGNLEPRQVEQIARELLADAIVEQTVLAPAGDAALATPPAAAPGESPRPVQLVHVLPKPGVMDPVAHSARAAIADLGITVDAIRTFRKYWIAGVAGAELQKLTTKILANDAIEQVIVGPLALERLELGGEYAFQLTTVPLRSLDDAGLMQLSKQGQLYLSLVEMQTIQTHFRELLRDPTDIELETIAQTWSEHCSHKTLAGRIAYRGPLDAAGTLGERSFENMLKETIFAATQALRKSWGDLDWCVSVFKDNAGIIRFDDDHNVVFKVETHNHPSALEPYGGANTGLGGVIRDPLGTGLGAKPVCSTDVFCFAPPDTPADSLPPGVLHPRRVMQGVVSGVRDYGNRMGIPTVNGAVYFDPRYLGNPLVYCGNVGIIPVDKSHKEALPGDQIVAVGGRTGRDGIHGATFSSAELTSESESLSGGAVQIGNAITEKMVLDVILQARDRGLYNAITDCGAGGFSSAVGEMGEEIGAEVWLDRCPTKYAGLSYTEIWISEAQERMILAVSAEQWPELEKLCQSEGVEATVIGRFEPTGRLRLHYQGELVGDLAMHFLHAGRPPIIREATYALAAPAFRREAGSMNGPDVAEDAALPTADVAVRPAVSSAGRAAAADNPSQSGPLPPTLPAAPYNATLLKILAALNVASKEWVIRQYDHEVQGGSVIKPLVGVANDGPSDAAVVRPVLNSRRGLVISCGMNPHYGDFDTYHMAASAIDEALRNCVAVGADPTRIAILDNFCWGDTSRPETLGSLVRAALACHDLAMALGTPFISGKDSLNNEFKYQNEAGEPQAIAIPPSLLISALGQIDDVRRCVTMDLKQSGNMLYQIGVTKNELAGSHFGLVERGSACAATQAPQRPFATAQPTSVPQVDPPQAKQIFAALHKAIVAGHVRACHDLSEGGLAVALAEMTFAGGLGAKVYLEQIPHDPAIDGESASCADVILLFSESNSRFVCEVAPDQIGHFETLLGDVPHAIIGEVNESGRLQIVGPKPKTSGGDLRHADPLQDVLVVDADLAELKRAWQQPLRW